MQQQLQGAKSGGHKELGKVGCKTCICFITAAAAIAIITLASIVVISIEMARLKSEITALKETNFGQERLFQRSLDNFESELSEVEQIQANHTQQLNTSLQMLHLNTDQLNSSIETISGDIIAIEGRTQLLIDYFQIGQSQENPCCSQRFLHLRVRILLGQDLQWLCCMCVL